MSPALLWCVFLQVCMCVWVCILAPDQWRCTNDFPISWTHFNLFHWKWSETLSDDLCLLFQCDHRRSTENIDMLSHSDSSKRQPLWYFHHGRTWVFFFVITWSERAVWDLISHMATSITYINLYSLSFRTHLKTFKLEFVDCEVSTEKTTRCLWPWLSDRLLSIQFQLTWLSDTPRWRPNVCHCLLFFFFFSIQAL